MKWYSTLVLIDRINRLVKEPGWRSEDVRRVYDMKDSFLKLLLEKKPDEVKVSLFYCPYFRYSDTTKNRAGDLMRADGKRYSFEYYLQQVEPSPYDFEDPERSTVEVVAVCNDVSFSFHMPVALLPQDCIAASLPRKAWVAAPEFHHQQLLATEAAFSALMEEL